MNTLSRSLQLGLALSVMLFMGSIWLIGNHAIRLLTEDIVVSRLQSDGENLLSLLLLDPAGVRVRWRRVDQIYNKPYSGHYYSILLEDGTLLTSPSLWDYRLPIVSLPPGESRRTRAEGPDGEELLLWLKGYRWQQTNLTLAVAGDITSIENERQRFRGYFALLALLGLLLLLTVQGLVVRRKLIRLEPVRRDIQLLEQGKKERITEDVPGEIQPLVKEFNKLLTLLAQRLERSRNALGNLAHALKGPLNLLVQYFDATAVDADDGRRRQAMAQVERISQLMERELKRARLAGGGAHCHRFHPHRELPTLEGVLKKLHSDEALTIRIEVGEETPPFGDREDMLELLGNLLDNACKWAISRVRCRVVTAGGIELIVEDDGAGISDREMHRLTQRGTRLDETVEGHGLGLAIAGDIVNLYGGTMEFDRSPDLGGLRVRVRLPLAGSGEGG